MPIIFQLVLENNPSLEQKMKENQHSYCKLDQVDQKVKWI